MLNKVEIPINPAELVLARKNAGMVNPSVKVDGKGQLIPRNKDSSAAGLPAGANTVMVRKSNNSGDLPKKAKSLKECKGLKGCDFAICAEKVFGKLPKNLEGLCSIEQRTTLVEIQ